jgi:hypothetical protein|tara:strand:- start:1394 stop:1861 length:468 start_codon:yes stop_codon:yes gene_type:complete
MSSSLQSTTSPKKKLKIKISKNGNKSGTSIKNIINDIYSKDNLTKSYLDYDIDISAIFLKNMTIDGEKPDLGIINSLPKLELKTQIIEDTDPDECLEEVINNPKEDNDDDIDKDALELETVGSKKYYLDYTKGIIYDLLYNAIGNIDEFGEINIS